MGCAENRTHFLFSCCAVLHDTVQPSKTDFCNFVTQRLKLTYLGQAAFRPERTAALRADPLNDRLGEKKSEQRKVSEYFKLLIFCRMRLNLRVPVINADGVRGCDGVE